MATNLNEIQALATSIWLTKNSVNASLDNIPFLYMLKEKDRLKKIDFSASVKYPTVLASSQVKATDSSGTGMTTHNTQASYAAEVFYKTVPVVRTISKDLIDLSKSKEAVVEEVLGVMLSSQSAILNSVEDMLYGDGSNFSGNALDGLGIAVSRIPSIGVYAGIDPSVTTQWQNYAVNQLDPASGVPNAGTSWTVDTIANGLSYDLSKLDENGRKPNLILMSTDNYNLLESALIKTQRNNDTISGDLGFRTLKYQGIPVINAGGLKRSGTIAGGVGGIPDKTVYYLSLDVCQLFYTDPSPLSASMAKEYGINTKDINAIVYPEMANGILLNTDKNTLDYYVKMVFKGNFVLGDRKIQGVHFEEVIV